MWLTQNEDKGADGFFRKINGEENGSEERKTRDFFVCLLLFC